MNWHEASNDELLNLPPETPLRFNGKVSTLGPYQTLYLPGDYPFLIGMANLGMIVEVPDEDV